MHSHDMWKTTCLHHVMNHPRSRDTSRFIFQDPVTLHSDGELKDILMLLVSAGADVYAVNDLGESPSDIAWRNDHEREWREALEECGYDPDEVDLHEEEEATCWTSGIDASTIKVQPEHLSFSEYLEIRKVMMNRFVEISEFSGPETSEPPGDDKAGSDAEVWDEDENWPIEDEDPRKDDVPAGMREIYASLKPKKD